MYSRSVQTVMLFAALVVPGLAQTAKQESVTAPRAVLVELFTSEGCSSCPPADALLRQVNGRKTDSGQLIVGISEHVTYWNQLGWSDPFSSHEFTDRQNGYGDRFHLDSVYTPQMVIDGETQIVGNDSAGLLRAVSQQKASPLSVHIESADAGGGSLLMKFNVNGDVPAKGIDIYAVVAEDAASSKVLRGENGGRTLQHVSVARIMVRVASVHAAGEQTARVALPTSAGQGLHLILFAQTSGLGRVLGIDTKPL
jgi:hypothetical protein